MKRYYSVGFILTKHLVFSHTGRQCFALEANVRGESTFSSLSEDTKCIRRRLSAELS